MDGFTSAIALLLLFFRILAAAWGPNLPTAPGGLTHRPLSSSFLGLPYRILNINHKKELLRGLWVEAI